MSEKEMLNKIADNPALLEESKTIRVMVNLYCRDNHEDLPPCESCLELLEYAIERVRQCPLQEERMTCGRCPIHCYKPARKAQAARIMRFSGPRMLLHHPLLAIAHQLDSFRKARHPRELTREQRMRSRKQ